MGDTDASEKEEFASDGYGADDPKNCRYSDRRPNLWDLAFFGHLTGVILRGSRQNLEARDLAPLRTSFTAKCVSEKFIRLFNEKQNSLKRQQCHRPSSLTQNDRQSIISHHRKAPKVNMIALIAQSFWPYFLSIAFFIMLQKTISMIPPALIGYYYDFLSNTNQNERNGYEIALVLFLAQQADSLLTAHVCGSSYNLGIKCRSGFSSAIYQKALRLSSKASEEFSAGDVVNLISVDLENVKSFVVLASGLITSPFSVILTFGLIYRYLGWYSLAGLGAVFLFGPLGALAAKFETKIQAKQMKRKDERVELLTEIANNVKVIKLYAWENAFIQRIRNIRKQETRLMYIYYGVGNLFGFLSNCYPFLISVAAIGAFLLFSHGGVLDPKKILVSISYFNAMRYELANLPYSVAVAAKAVVSLNRIRNFLEADEINTTLIKDELANDEEITLRNATLSWNDMENPTLKEINLTVRKGELVAVVGTVASGKSSLIQAIIGEMSVLDGSINRNKSSTLAYVPQQAWILNNTIKSNILFGSQYKPVLYHDVVMKCSLVPDLKILPAGDKTEIGEKGVNLSGGQKQRVSLARAVYQNADIYLLDDPLSAVDAHVAQSLFEDVIGPQGLLGKKTRLLVTHTVSVLPLVDRIVVIEDGKITHQGTYEEIMQQNVKLKELVKTHTATDKTVSTGKATSAAENQGETFIKRKLSTSSASSDSSSPRDREHCEIPGERITEEEEMQIGQVRWGVYFEFIWYFGIMASLVTICGFILFQLATNASLYFVSKWGEKMKENNGTTTEDAMKSLHIYLAFGGVQAAAILGALTALTFGCVWTSTTLHNKMLEAVLRAPMRFFDSTPVGRILNRFSRDVDELDVSLCYSAKNYLEMLSQFGVVIALICIQLPPFLVVLVPLMIGFFALQKFYMGSSRQIKRLNAITKSPVLNSFNETLMGTTSIRAYGSQKLFVRNNMRLLDNNQNCLYHEYNGYRWLAIRINTVGALLSAAVVALLTVFRGSLETVTAILVFNFALEATAALTWIIRLGAQVENSLVSAERIIEYTKVKPEAPWVIEGDVSASWPDRGEVVFNEYSTRYREGLDLVIKQINLHINPSEKVGIVGRTGAGKSSLTLALLRIIEAAEGKILIDGADISKVGLHTLRSRIALIPQDPILFKGSLRRNVDPEDKYTNEEIWTALENAHLKRKDKGIDFQVNEGGTNLSVGERQLVCLARALLRKSKVLILDEATAAVDLKTDELIQQTIRSDFQNSTVITIAHRLHTIMDYDKIVVMDNGQIGEVGSPQELLEDPDSLFSALARYANIRSHTKS